MDKPRLKINDKEVGLRDLGNGLFEPKNLNVLNEVFHGYHEPKAAGRFFVENQIAKEEPEKYHKIQSFCFVVTENIKEEGAMMLKSLRKFHDQPVYVICDQSSIDFLEQQGFKDDLLIHQLISKEELQKINEEIFKNHKCIANEIHRPAEILTKMDAMNLALRHHDNTFFLDADIIILDSLQEYFKAKVVLSPHYYPKNLLFNGFENGFYNAGYVFCASKGFPNFWKHIYLNDSIFFEQECMNRIPDILQIQTFSREHNVGFWRRKQIPEKVKSFHFHITKGVDKNRNKSLKQLNHNIKEVAINCLRTDHPDLYDYYVELTKPKKVAFVHFGKAAGVYVNQYLKNGCLKDYKKYFSWHIGSNPMGISGRDWNKDELMSVAETAPDYSFITNHHIFWDTETIQKFKDSGWFLFTFLRRPEELLCSLHHWAKENKIKLSDLPEAENLEQTFEYAVNDADFSKLWKAPDYIDMLDYKAEFSDENFKDFLSEFFYASYTPKEKANTSKNKSFNYYREKGEISDGIASELLSHPEYERYLTYL